MTTQVSIGFGTDACVPLYMAGGMEITNGYPADPIPVKGRVG